MRLIPVPRRGMCPKALPFPIPLPGFSRLGIPGDQLRTFRNRILQERASVRLSGQALFCPSFNLYGSDFPDDPDMSCRDRVPRARFPGSMNTSQGRSRGNLLRFESLRPLEGAARCTGDMPGVSRLPDGAGAGFLHKGANRVVQPLFSPDVCFVSKKRYFMQETEFVAVFW